MEKRDVLWDYHRLSSPGQFELQCTKFIIDLMDKQIIFRIYRHTKGISFQSKFMPICIEGIVNYNANTKSYQYKNMKW